MPLGERAGWEKSESRYCGVETEFDDDVPRLITFHLSTGGFDFVLAPLMNPTYRPSLIEKHNNGSHVLPFAGSDPVLSPSQWSCHVVFPFVHPDHTMKKTNEQYTKLQLEIPGDSGSAMVHGFAGYFDAVLYKDVHLGTEPSSATPNMFHWFAIFFPLRAPVCIQLGSPLEVHFWRRCGPSKAKVWYEWCVTSPNPSAIHNSNGRSYRVGL